MPTVYEEQCEWSNGTVCPRCGTTGTTLMSIGWKVPPPKGGNEIRLQMRCQYGHEWRVDYRYHTFHMEAIPGCVTTGKKSDESE
jgi:hypothetical protein